MGIEASAYFGTHQEDGTVFPCIVLSGRRGKVLFVSKDGGHKAIGLLLGCRLIDKYEADLLTHEISLSSIPDDTHIEDALLAIANVAFVATAMSRPAVVESVRSPVTPPSKAHLN